jgi:hypothetical protein
MNTSFDFWNMREFAKTICFSVAVTCFACGVTIAQDDEKSSRRETEAIKKVEENGGRVYRISAADTSREVSFYLSSKPVGDEALSGINAVSEVIWLNLAGTEITNDGLKHLAGLPLKKLHLERTKIGDDGLKHLKLFKDLTYLNLYDTKVTDAGLEHLKELKKLEKLFVWKSAVTEAGIKKLNESLPDLKIVGELKLEPVVIEEPKQEEPKEGDAKKEDAKQDEAKTDDKEAVKEGAEKKPGQKKKGAKRANRKKANAAKKAAAEKKKAEGDGGQGKQ